jgi:hypothetical protein
VAKAIRRGKRAAGYLLRILGGISLAISVVLVAVWNAASNLTVMVGLFLLFAGQFVARMADVQKSHQIREGKKR